MTCSAVFNDEEGEAFFISSSEEDGYDDDGERCLASSLRKSFIFFREGFGGR